MTIEAKSTNARQVVAVLFIGAAFNNGSTSHEKAGLIKAYPAFEQTEAIRNLVTGCTRVSAGCDLCYAVTMTNRLAAMGLSKYEGLVYPHKIHFNGVIRTHPEALAIRFETKRPTVWFANSMSDLFHRDVPRHSSSMYCA